MNLTFTPEDLATVLGMFKRTAAEPSLDGPFLLIAKNAYADGMRDLGNRKPEVGGLLIGPKGHRGVTHYIPDTSGKSTSGSFTWDHGALNATLKKFTAVGMDAKGFWHSHPHGYRKISDGDIEFVRTVVLAPGNDVEEVLMPLYVDGECLPFIVYPDLRVVKAQLATF